MNMPPKLLQERLLFLCKNYKLFRCEAVFFQNHLPSFDVLTTKVLDKYITTFYVVEPLPLESLADYATANVITPEFLFQHLPNVLNTLAALHSVRFPYLNLSPFSICFDETLSLRPPPLNPFASQKSLMPPPPKVHRSSFRSINESRFYRAPEWESIDPFCPSDSWALGAILSEYLIFGGPMFGSLSKDDQMKRTQMILGTAPKFLNWPPAVLTVPCDLPNIILELLDYDPNRRPWLCIHFCQRVLAFVHDAGRNDEEKPTEDEKKSRAPKNKNKFEEKPISGDYKKSQELMNKNAEREKEKRRQKRKDDFDQESSKQYQEQPAMLNSSALSNDRQEFLSYSDEEKESQTITISSPIANSATSPIPHHQDHNSSSSYTTQYYTYTTTTITESEQDSQAHPSYGSKQQIPIEIEEEEEDGDEEEQTATIVVPKEKKSKHQEPKSRDSEIKPKQSDAKPKASKHKRQDSPQSNSMERKNKGTQGIPNYSSQEIQTNPIHDRKKRLAKPPIEIEEESDETPALDKEHDYSSSDTPTINENTSTVQTPSLNEDKSKDNTTSLNESSTVQTPTSIHTKDTTEYSDESTQYTTEISTTQTTPTSTETKTRSDKQSTTTKTTSKSSTAPTTSTTTTTAKKSTNQTPSSSSSRYTTSSNESYADNQSQSTSYENTTPSSMTPTQTTTTKSQPSNSYSTTSTSSSILNQPGKGSTKEYYFKQTTTKVTTNYSESDDDDSTRDSLPFSSTEDEISLKRARMKRMKNSSSPSRTPQSATTETTTTITTTATTSNDQSYSDMNSTNYSSFMASQEILNLRERMKQLESSIKQSSGNEMAQIPISSDESDQSSGNDVVEKISQMKKTLRKCDQRILNGCPGCEEIIQVAQNLQKQEIFFDSMEDGTTTTNTGSSED